MKAEDFLSQRTPKSRGSKLAPAWPEIRKLREAGCSLYEIQEFLKTNNIETSVPNLAAFIKRQEAKEQPVVDRESAVVTKPIVEVQTESSTDIPVSAEPDPDALEQALKAKGAKFDELDKKRNLSDRFNQKKGTK